jgi:SAM-dependent methyltransferase
MENVWFTPAGYQRTAKRLQFKCLNLLLQFAEVKGRILDVGCGTGGSLQIIDPRHIDSYKGIDISTEMITYARAAHAGAKRDFVIADFLAYQEPVPMLYDHVICAACLHWFIPNEKKVIEKISGMLGPGGLLSLSCAFDFNYLQGEQDMQRTVLQEVRQQFTPVSPLVVFDDFRFTRQKLRNYVQGFDLLKSCRIEEVVEFSCYEDFRDWHLGSGSVVYQQFSEEDRERAVNHYYEALFRRYETGEHQVSYSTGLFLFRKEA